VPGLETCAGLRPRSSIGADDGRIHRADIDHAHSPRTGHDPRPARRQRINSSCGDWVNVRPTATADQRMPPPPAAQRRGDRRLGVDWPRARRSAGGADQARRDQLPRQPAQHKAHCSERALTHSSRAVKAAPNGDWRSPGDTEKTEILASHKLSREWASDRSAFCCARQICL
jgi:hypothetical protein